VAAVGGACGWRRGGSSNSKNQIKKQLKKPDLKAQKPDLYEEEKIETLRWMGRRSPLLWW
jgi:hypothetical protein